MRLVKSTDPLPRDKLGQLAVYNALDCLTLYEIRDGLLSEMQPHHRAIYEFEMDLQSALLEMSCNGIPVDIPRRQTLIEEHESERVRIKSYIHTLLEAIAYYEYYQTIIRIRFSNACKTHISSIPCSWAEWLNVPISTRRHWKATAGEQATKDFQKGIKEFGKPFNPNSPTQKIRLFYHFFGIDTNEVSQDDYSDFPPPWGRTKGLHELRTRSVNGEYTQSVDRDSLEKLASPTTKDQSFAVFWALPLINLCLYYTDLSKTLQFLNCKLERGWFYSSFGSAPETGRLSSRKSNFGGLGWNAQNTSAKLRVIFTSPLGWKSITLDYEQIESRMVAARCFLQFSTIRYIAMTECGDEHSLAASMVWDDLPWPKDFTLEWTIKHGPFPSDMISAAKKISKVTFYRDKSRRDMSKMIGHASKYWGKPPQIAKQSHVDIGLIQHYQNVLFNECPEIPQWHQWIIEQVQVYGEFATIFGRVRRFLNRPSDSATIREAIAQDGQSPAADYTNIALLTLHKEALCKRIPITLFLQKHDEIGARFKEQDEFEVVTKMKKIMEQHYTLTAPDGTVRDWYVPAEVLVGWNLGRQSELNPDGLIEWAGKDNRTRQRNPFNSGLKVTLGLQELRHASCYT